jgi:transposase
METRALAGVKKNAESEGRTIVFIDESGLSQRPHRCRTWSPKGQTPVLQYHFNWKALSVAVGISWWSFYFRLFPGSIKAPQLIEFLTHLLRHIPGPVLVIWDGLPTHRSALVKLFVAGLNGRLRLAYLPAYAPELNPCEYIFGHLKHHQLPNLCPRTFWELGHHARRALRRMRRRPTLIRAFWKQSTLFEDVTILSNPQ